MTKKETKHATRRTAYTRKPLSTSYLLVGFYRAKSWAQVQILRRRIQHASIPSALWLKFLSWIRSWMGLSRFKSPFTPIWIKLHALVIRTARGPVANEARGGPSVIWEFVWEMKLRWNKWTKSGKSYQWYVNIVTWCRCLCFYEVSARFEFFYIIWPDSVIIRDYL